METMGNTTELTMKLIMKLLLAVLAVREKREV